MSELEVKGDSFGVKDEEEAYRANIEKVMEANRVLAEVDNSNQQVKADIWHRSWEMAVERSVSRRVPPISGLWAWVTLPRTDSVAFEAFVVEVCPDYVVLELSSGTDEDGERLVVPWSAGPVFRFKSGVFTP